MQVRTIESSGSTIAVVHSEDVLIHSVASALDFMATIRYECECDRVALNKEAIHEEFFRLSSGLAGEILQKFVNYQLKLAIYGDYSRYTSKPLKDFMYESNRGSHVYFVITPEEAIEKLRNAC